ncbi:hypothetical protein PN471_22720 [Aphanizomenon sp. CS-733/32]|uniref:hypothetical protein n=1 Tax=Aphanizomenon sp. CS-733/32 TaxID=3021715 RepID=UPI00232F4B34|nr:hypothetical protein [Aphanizomenon sp. CS-733/32]MDB9311387.1 hypothetical protein [Aphanizomenon sp. CS-733/32]
MVWAYFDKLSTSLARQQASTAGRKSKVKSQKSKRRQYRLFKMIVKYSQEDALTVQEVLKDWTQFLQKQENYQPPRYRFYHES